MTGKPRKYVAFSGMELVMTGRLAEVVDALKPLVDRDGRACVAIYDHQSCYRLDIDFRGTTEEVLARLAEHPMLPKPREEKARRAGPGRPRLGVVSREVTLLPRHWEWLSSQKGGASAALRRLVDAARKEAGADDKSRAVKEALHRFLWDMAGDLPDFEEVTRALDGGHVSRIIELTREWPEGIRRFLSVRLAELNSDRSRTP